MIESVGELGLAATSVADVAARAHVSRTAFYEQFDDKPACFRAAYSELTAGLLAELAGVGVEEPSYVEGVRRSVETYLGWCIDWPSGARAWHLGVLALEPDGLELRDAAVDRIESLFRAGANRARREQASLPPAHEFMFAAAGNATLDLVSTYIRDGRLAEIGELTERVLYLWLLAIADQRVAERSTDLA